MTVLLKKAKPLLPLRHVHINYVFPHSHLRLLRHLLSAQCYNSDFLVFTPLKRFVIIWALNDLRTPRR